MDYLYFLLWPFVACVVLVGIHVYFGLHIIQRGIIFVDLSLAQIAALGTTVAFLVGYAPESRVAYLFSLGFALIGATVFTLTRSIQGKVPQEAVIGIVYAVSSAAAIMAVSHQPEGAEHIRHLLVGSLLTVTPAAIGKTALVYAAIGMFHWFYRRRFLSLTFGAATPSRAALWDFLFYATFAMIVTSSVVICGVLVVFVFLVVPSVFAALQTDRIGLRLALGWVFGLAGAAAGIVLSFVMDTPTGATIVCTFGLMLLLYAAYRRLIA